MDKKYTPPVALKTDDDLDSEIFQIAPYRVDPLSTASLPFSRKATRSAAPLPQAVADVPGASIQTLWQITKGRGVKVAVLDSGIASHPLLPRIADCRDFTNSGTCADAIGHGTHVAGIIAGLNDIGVAPEVELYVGKVIRQLNGGRTRQLLAGIEWAIEQGVQLINLSVGSRIEPAQELRAALRRAAERNIFVICSAGNSARPIDYPAQYDECFAVGAVDSQGNRWEDNSDDEESAVGVALDLMAPGEFIKSTFLNNNLLRLSGTSMAAPFVTGVVALALSKQRLPGTNSARPIRTVKDLMDRFRETTTPRIPAEEYGLGIINAQALFNSI